MFLEQQISSPLSIMDKDDSKSLQQLQDQLRLFIKTVINNQTDMKHTCSVRPKQQGDVGSQRVSNPWMRWRKRLVLTAWMILQCMALRWRKRMIIVILCHPRILIVTMMARMMTMTKLFQWDDDDDLETDKIEDDEEEASKQVWEWFVREWGIVFQ